MTVQRTCIRKTITASTNEDAKELIKASDAPLYTLIRADEQTGGRGRLGRQFFSPAGGLYFSAVYPLPVGQPNLPFLTLLAGYAASKAIDGLSHSDTKIKWPNDILLEDKKVCGILTEAVSANSRVNAVVGFGVNLSLPAEDIPADLKNKMASLFSLGYEVPDKDALMCRITDILDNAVYERGALTLPPEDILRELDSRSYLAGKRVGFTDRATGMTGVAGGIAPDGSLCVTLDDQRVIRVKFGEVILLSEA